MILMTATTQLWHLRLVLEYHNRETPEKMTKPSKFEEKKKSRGKDKQLYILVDILIVWLHSMLNMTEIRWFLLY